MTPLLWEVDPPDGTKYPLIKQRQRRVLSDVELTACPQKPFVSERCIKAL